MNKSQTNIRGFRRYAILFSVLLFTGIRSVCGQIMEPVKWDTDIEKLSDTEYNLVFTAKIDDHWHLYSQHLPESGALPTVFTFENAGTGYAVSGATVESKPITEYDRVFETDLSYFENNARFSQKIEVLEDDLSSIHATVEFQACNDESCIFDSKEFRFVIDKNTALPEKDGDVAATEKTPSAGDDKNFVDTGSANKGMLTIFFIAFLSGFAALLTPCVFPMIPMTVSFFTKQSKNRASGIRNAVFYGISIIVIYVILGSLVTGIFGADSLNALSTNAWFNLVFFLLLIIFAASFLGAFEIVLPYSWANKVDRQSDRGGMIGILFMALALAIVSFSCTGPIVGTLLVEAAGRGGVAPVIGMLGFSSALALPFMLFAMFPGWMNSLPRSGGWLNTVKVFLGFLELALAFKFLSNADLVLQLHVLERELFIAIWIAVFTGLTLYLFGWIKLPHDSPGTHISVPRLGLALTVLMFTIYLVPGLWGAPLKLISGFPPPMQYSESPHGVGYARGGVAGGTPAVFPEGAHAGPHDIALFTDYDKGVAYARKVNKPVLLDFTGHACVNCRKMEERVWSDPAVLQRLKNNFVLISLYVDDKRKLPENERYVSPDTGKKIITIGQKWSDFQISRYRANAQPFYAITSPEANDLVSPVGYEPDAARYLQWLNKGIKQFGLQENDL
ncbi:Thiol:disulfide interchange protein DsbD [Sinomicrobium oceani]|uniref:Thiol:disulfide interchange protein DsbD n=1 Tax=Sinomicrobium oceani TaxID=1150368 RepID=A0A1K1M4N1_9FLAO|nr:Thiol:disulfide interchange protein DsbD [Sinomicrobium oceani]